MNAAFQASVLFLYEADFQMKLSTFFIVFVVDVDLRRHGDDSDANDDVGNQHVQGRSEKAEAKARNTYKTYERHNEGNCTSFRF